MKAKKIRYAVVGQGYISQIAVLPAFKHAKNSELVALVSGDEKKLKTLGKKYKVKNLYNYEDFEKCLNQEEIDAVYIALPNDRHREFTEKAAQAGIHVICEKPMAVSSKDCEAMIQAAQQNHVKLMIAYRLHFEEANLKAIQIVKSGKIGTPKVFTSIFTQPSKEQGIRLRPHSQGGGPTFDIGIYCINTARYIFRDEPTEVIATPIKSTKETFRNIEEGMSVVLRFPENRVAQFTVSFGCASTGDFQIVGTKGDLKVNHAYSFIGEKVHKLTIKEKTRTKKFKSKDQFASEIIYFSDCILKNKNPEPSGEEGLADIRIIENIFKSADSGRPISLQEMRENIQYPEESQKINQPQVQKPEMINAEEPTKNEAA